MLLYGLLWLTSRGLAPEHGAIIRVGLTVVLLAPMLLAVWFAFRRPWPHGGPAPPATSPAPSSTTATSGESAATRRRAEARADAEQRMRQRSGANGAPPEAEPIKQRQRGTAATRQLASSGEPAPPSPGRRRSHSRLPRRRLQASPMPPPPPPASRASTRRLAAPQPMQPLQPTAATPPAARRRSRPSQRAVGRGAGLLRHRPEARRHRANAPATAPIAPGGSSSAARW